MHISFTGHCGVKRKKMIGAGKNIIPFHLYIDDTGINNPLGPHTDPITFLYHSFPVLERQEIYLAAVIKSIHYKEFGNEKCLKAVVREIKNLEEHGLTVSTSEGSKKVYFVLALPIGDNLGLNKILGFTSSFSHNFFCRFCKAKKPVTQTMQVEIPQLARNLQNYEADVSMSTADSTGIKESTIFNEIDTFHVASNYSVDVMHDIFEGVCHYDMCHIINYFIINRYFTLKTLNTRKHVFNYGDMEIDNISSEIKQAHLSKFRLKMTAREMMTFIHLFTLMIGDLIPEGNEVWLFFLNLVDIIEILLSFEIPYEKAEELNALIRKHHEGYIRYFNDTLKPKHHFMVHYCTVIQNSGPPRFYWSFPFEAKHKVFKMYARNITSRINICVSISRKYQLMFANSLMQPVEPILKLDLRHSIPLEHSDLLFHFCEEHEINAKYESYKECIYNSKKYKTGYFVTQHTDVMAPDTKYIFKIVEIVVFDK
ncbi:uncharacterized protein LOC129768690 [Toxorhynchites rutilus septentrionalis]|uniref:uncharacterized protein LOC129768690 n=1 Tax=Toxorhynchites rutilus septentrionalis TaxID=329112 RepID=UPI002479A305|nr:uncharacterized protein LOC129768690 [Toxorhynchites rutilus septentrionalis]XP_055626456.1 uncharacterized protein LOC129768690 [Toxorhynchites rutilus septentrionalis]